MSGLRGVFIIILKGDCMRIAPYLKQFQNLTAQNLCIVLTKFCTLAVHKARKLYQACGLRQWHDFMDKAIELTTTTHCVDFCGFALVSNL